MKILYVTYGMLPVFLLSALNVSEVSASRFDPEVEATINLLRQSMPGYTFFTMPDKKWTQEEYKFAREQQSAKDGHFPSMVNVAQYLAYGVGCKKDHAMAFEWLEKALLTNVEKSAKDYLIIGQVYDSLELDHLKEVIRNNALKCFQTAFDKGEKAARKFLASILTKIGTPGSYQQAYDHYVVLDKEGDLIASYCMAFLIAEEKINIHIIPNRAHYIFSLVEKAARGGLKAARSQYLSMLYNQSGCVLTPQNQVRLFEGALEEYKEGNKKACLWLSLCYMQGFGVSVDYPKALKFLDEGLVAGIRD